MNSYEFWRDHDNGEVWAVKLVDGVVNGACGPLDVEEIDESFLDALVYQTAPGEVMEHQRDRYELYEPAVHA